MIYGPNGLDLDFSETKKELNIPTMGKHKYRFSEDPMFEALGKNLSKIDYIQHVTRFRWNNLPEGLDSELFERILYYSGSAMFFYIKELDKFFFLPYGMSGEKTETGIDFYGRFKKLKPYSFNGATEEKRKNSTADIYLSTQLRDNIIDVPMVSSLEEAKKIYEEGAVICWDSTPELAYYTDSRNRKSKSYIDYMVKALIQTKSALINSSGFNLFAADGEADNDIMQLQLDSINEDREKGKLAAVVSKLLGEIQNLQSNSPAAMADFWSSFQSIDNLRLKSLGIQNDGVIQKSQYQNIQEQAIDINDCIQVYLNAFMERIKFSAIVNSIWGLDIYPEPILMPGLGGGNTNQEEEKEEGSSDNQAQEGTDET